MLRRIAALCAVVMAMFSALAVTVIAPKQDAAERLSRARRDAAATRVGHYGMTPIAGALVADGDYPVVVESSSPYFKIAEATLHVSGGGMTADITVNSTSYDAMRMDAEIMGDQRDGRTVFTIPVPALNMAFDCAAHSVKRDRWYDRQLLVDAASLPPEALPFTLPDYALLEQALRDYGPAAEADAEAETTAGEPQPTPVSLPDGEYAIEVNLSGGSGRASVSSPTVLIVREGGAWARLLWSSAYYDYMLVGGARYENLSADGGNSTFEIPIPAMDQPVPVVADTTAMGDPVEIQYQLTFYAESIGDKSQVPQEAAKQVLMISLAIIVVGGALNYVIKKRRS